MHEKIVSMANSFIDDFVWSGKKEFRRVRFFFDSGHVRLTFRPNPGWVRITWVAGEVNITIVMVVLESNVKPYSTLRFVRLIALP